MPYQHVGDDRRVVIHSNTIMYSSLRFIYFLASLLFGVLFAVYRNIRMVVLVRLDWLVVVIIRNTPPTC